MGKFQNVLKSLRKSKGLTQDELAKRLKISRSTIGMYENGSREPDFETIELIADFFNVDIDYLLGRTDKTTYIPDRIPMSEFHTIPLFADVAGGLPLLMDDRIVGEVAVTGIPDNGEYFALTVRGQSMEPKIMDGDIVVVHQQQDVDNGDIAIITIDGESATCKRLYTYADHISLLSINPACEPMEFSREQIEDLPVHVYGKVVQLVRRF